MDGKLGGAQYEVPNTCAQKQCCLHVIEQRVRQHLHTRTEKYGMYGQVLIVLSRYSEPGQYIVLSQSSCIRMDKPEAIRMPLITDCAEHSAVRPSTRASDFYKSGTTCYLTYDQPRCRTCG
jgi:hypothetical protein